MLIGTSAPLGYVKAGPVCLQEESLLTNGPLRRASGSCGVGQGRVRTTLQINRRRSFMVAISPGGTTATFQSLSLQRTTRALNSLTFRQVTPRCVSVLFYSAKQPIWRQILRLDQGWRSPAHMPRQRGTYGRLLRSHMRFSTWHCRSCGRKCVMSQEQRSPIVSKWKSE